MKYLSSCFSVDQLKARYFEHMLNFLVGEHCSHILPGPASDCHQPNLQRHLWLHFLTAAGKGSPICEQKIVQTTWLFLSPLE
jgi:hypothetical protein